MILLPADATDVGDILYQDILDNPSDDLLRHIYADWLMDTGRIPYAAEFIKLQLRIFERDPHYCINDNTSDKIHTSSAIEDVRRAYELLVQIYRVEMEADMAIWKTGFRRTWRRGFPEQLHCSMHSWVDHHKTLPRYPVTDIHFTDRTPGRYQGISNGKFVWMATQARSWRDGGMLFADRIPWNLAQFMRGHVNKPDFESAFFYLEYDSEEHARECLSQACLLQAGWIEEKE